MGKKNNKGPIDPVEKFKEFGYKPIGNKSNDPVDDAMQYAFMYQGKETKPYIVDLEWFFKRIHCRCPDYGTVGFRKYFFLGKDCDDILDSVELYDRETKDGRFYYVDKERYDKIKKYLKPLTRKVYSPKDDCEIEIEVDDNGNPLPPKESEPTIQFDKKVLESGLSFKEAYMRMVEGKKISRPCFMGWWFMNHESKVIIHDRYGNELKEGDITNTVTNTLANDWEVIE